MTESLTSQLVIIYVNLRTPTTFPSVGLLL